MTPRLGDELDQALQAHRGFVQAEGADGKAIVMSMPVCREMRGVGSDDEMAASLAAIAEVTADVAAGRTTPMDQVFLELDATYGVFD